MAVFNCIDKCADKYSRSEKEEIKRFEALFSMLNKIVPQIVPVVGQLGFFYKTPLQLFQSRRS